MLSLIIIFVNFFSASDAKTDLVATTPTISLPKDLSGTEMVDFWYQTIKDIGGEPAYAAFKEVLTNVDSNRKHEQAHIFGEALFKAMGLPGVAVCDSDFGFGCYHSFFGFALLEHGTQVLPELDQECIKVHGPKGLGCQHGIGHGVLSELGYDNLQLALDECLTLNWQGPIGGCTSGVLMEYNHHTMLDSTIRPLDERGWHYPCNVLPERFVQACYFEQPAWWNRHAKQDWEIVGHKCSEVKEKQAREVCFQGVGNVLAGITHFDLKEMRKQCDRMPDSESILLCTEGAAWITSHAPGMQDSWKILCEPFTGEYLDRCIASHNFI